jgi:hypothetical protein
VTDPLATVIATALREARQLDEAEVRRIVREELSSRSTGPEPVRIWLTQAEAARVADKTPQTIRAWLRAGLLGAPGRRGSINAERLRAFLAGGAVARAARPSRLATEITAEVLGRKAGEG